MQMISDFRLNVGIVGDGDDTLNVWFPSAMNQALKNVFYTFLRILYIAFIDLW